MEVYMVHLLMRNPAIVLQDVVVLDVLRNGNALCNRQHLGKLVIWDVVKFCAVVFRDDEL